MLSAGSSRREGMNTKVCCSLTVMMRQSAAQKRPCDPGSDAGMKLAHPGRCRPGARSRTAAAAARGSSGSRRSRWRHARLAPPRGPQARPAACSCLHAPRVTPGRHSCIRASFHWLNTDAWEGTQRETGRLVGCCMVATHTIGPIWAPHVQDAIRTRHDCAHIGLGTAAAGWYTRRLQQMQRA